jgi:hypothetical protein
VCMFLINVGICSARNNERNLVLSSSSICANCHRIRLSCGIDGDDEYMCQKEPRRVEPNMHDQELALFNIGCFERLFLIQSQSYVTAVLFNQKKAFHHITYFTRI